MNTPMNTPIKHPTFSEAARAYGVAGQGCSARLPAQENASG